MESNYLDWIAKAESDWKIVKLVTKNNFDPADLLCFHCHQVAEKYLKAFMSFKNIPTVKTHDLLKLQKLILGEDATFFEFSEDFNTLNDYGITPKYPDEFYNPTEEECEKAVKLAKGIRKFCREKMKAEKAVKKK